MVTLYGIKNCDTVKKARRWLSEHQIEFQFHDLRHDGLTHGQVLAWLERLGGERLINRRSTTWKQLTEEQREAALSANASAAEILVSHPTLIKRPLIDTGRALHCGFSDADYNALFT